MELPPYIRLPALDADGRVADDAACVQCGYNLRLCPSAGSCPECAHSVWHSVRSFYLVCAPAAWVLGLARGLAAVVWATVIGIVLTVVLAVVNGIAAAAGVGSYASQAPSIMIAVAQQLLYGLLIAWAIYGLVLFTRPEPGTQGRPEGLTSRRLLRIGCWIMPWPVVINLVLTPVSATLAGEMLQAGLTPGIALAFMTLQVVGVVIGAVYVVVPVLVARRLWVLLPRVPRPGLRRFAGITFWGLIVSSVLGVAMYALFLVLMMPLLVAGTSVTTVGPTGSVTYTSSSWSSVSPGGLPYTTQPSTSPSGANVNGAPAASMPQMPPGYVSGPLTTAPVAPIPPMGVPTVSRAITFSLIAGCGMCGTLGFWLCGLVLMILSCGTFFAVARAAEQIAAEPAAAAGANATAPPPA